MSSCLTQLGSGFQGSLALMALTSEVTSLYIVVALLASRDLESFSMRAVRQNQINPYECGSSNSKVDDCASYIQLVEL
jgi:hypothetical protein